MFTHAIVYDDCQCFTIINNTGRLHSDDSVAILKYDGSIIMMVPSKNEALSFEEFLCAIRQHFHGPQRFFGDFSDDIDDDTHMEEWYDAPDWSLAIFEEQFLPAVRAHTNWDIEDGIATAYWIEKVYTRD